MLLKVCKNINIMYAVYYIPQYSVFRIFGIRQLTGEDMERVQHSQNLPHVYIIVYNKITHLRILSIDSENS